jgi:hypothetical protein
VQYEPVVSLRAGIREAGYEQCTDRSSDLIAYVRQMTSRYFCVGGARFRGRDYPAYCTLSSQREMVVLDSFGRSNLVKKNEFSARFLFSDLMWEPFFCQAPFSYRVFFLQ